MKNVFDYGKQGKAKYEAMVAKDFAEFRKKERALVLSRIKERANKHFLTMFKIFAATLVMFFITLIILLLKQAFTTP